MAAESAGARRERERGYDGGMSFLRGAAVALAIAAAGCGGDETAPSTPHEPFLWVTADRHDDLVARADREPYASIVAVIQKIADRPWAEPESDRWDSQTISGDNQVAQANAVLAWLYDDETRARKAVDFMLRMPTDFENNDVWDVDIRMAHVIMTYAYAWDLLRATPYMSDEEAADTRQRVLTVTEKFFDDYIENGIKRQAILGFEQNNHPIRTASAVGLVALLFPDYPAASTWANFAVSELSYLMGPDGKYIQPDGGVSEGPFYYAFAYGPAVAFFIAMDHIDPNRTFQRDCRNRQDSDPWNVTDCVDGEAFTFENPLHGDLLAKTVDWSIDLRLPSGWRAPLGDANFIFPNGSVLLTSFGGGPEMMWDWETKPEDWRRA